jgi:hypothetical protein
VTELVGASSELALQISTSALCVLLIDDLKSSLPAPKTAIVPIFEFWRVSYSALLDRQIGDHALKRAGFAPLLEVRDLESRISHGGQPVTQV